MSPSSEKMRPAKQKRSEISQNKILDAAAILFAEKGYSKTHVSDIIKLSGVSTGSFYHGFKDKMAVFFVLLEKYVDESNEIIASYDFSKDTHANLRELFLYLTETGSERARKSRGFLMAANEVSIDQQYVWDRMRDLTKYLCDRAAENVDDYASEITCDAPKEGMRRAVQLMISVLINNEIHPAVYIPTNQADKVSMLADAMLGIVRPHS
ncbi:MAG: TetR/AcrR family transcriptional regulator [Sneathiella sp.]